MLFKEKNLDARYVHYARCMNKYMLDFFWFGPIVCNANSH